MVSKHQDKVKATVGKLKQEEQGQVQGPKTKAVDKAIKESVAQLRKEAKALKITYGHLMDREELKDALKFKKDGNQKGLDGVVSKMKDKAKAIRTKYKK